MTRADGPDAVLAFIEHARSLDLAPRDRDEHRPLAGYPRLPPQTCELSARLLAGLYPELTAVSGTLEWSEDGTRLAMSHWWCTRADGKIIDPTWKPPPGCGEVTYRQA